MSLIDIAIAKVLGVLSNGEQCPLGLVKLLIDIAMTICFVSIFQKREAMFSKEFKTSCTIVLEKDFKPSD